MIYYDLLRLPLRESHRYKDEVQMAQVKVRDGRAGLHFLVEERLALREAG